MFQYDFMEIDRVNNKLKNFNGYTWLTNFNNEQLGIYEKVIELNGDDNLFCICENAYDSNGRYIDGYSALHITRTDEDLSEFWRIFDNLRK